MSDKEGRVRKTFPLHVLKTEARTRERGTIIRAILNSGRKDRDREMINPSGWKIPDVLPKVMYGHDYGGFPVGKFIEPPQAKRIGLVGVMEMADTRDPDLPAIGRQVSALVRGGFIDQGSVGFSPLKWVNADGTEQSIEKGDSPGWPQPERRYVEQEMYEWSFTPVPSDVGSVVLGVGKSAAFQMARLAMRGQSIDGVLRALKSARSAASGGPARPDGSGSGQAGAHSTTCMLDCCREENLSKLFTACTLCALGVEFDEKYARLLRSMIAGWQKSNENETAWKHLNYHAQRAGKPLYPYIHDDALEAEWIAETGSPFAAESVA